MAELAFRNDEKVGLAAALVLHGALVAVLLMQTVRSEVSVFPERMTVSLTTEVGLEAASPDPVAESRAAVAPTLSDAPAPAPDPARPERVERAAPVPPPPKPAAQPVPARDRSRPDRTPPKAASTPSTPSNAAAKGGGSRIGDDFLDGKGSSTTTQETRVPAATFGSTERAALDAAITRQLRPYWKAPSGLDAEKLESVVAWQLNPDGSLSGNPTCRTDPVTINESNKPQAALHCERAIRAVREAAKVRFNLPPQHYGRWKSLEWDFNRKL